MQQEQYVIIGLCAPKSPTNVGAIMRAAGCYQANEVRFTGERFERANKFHTDTKDMQSKIPLKKFTDLSAELSNDVQLICVELVEGATPLPEFIHPAKAMYVFGPEDGSIAQDLINKADSVVYIPTIGCMNLAATVNVLLYDRLAKASASIDHAQRIKNSPDINNRLRMPSK